MRVDIMVRVCVGYTFVFFDNFHIVFGGGNGAFVDIISNRSIESVHSLFIPFLYVCCTYFRPETISLFT